MIEEQIIKQINENPDSLDIGTAGKGGNIKVYGNFNDPDAFKVKVDNAIELRSYAQLKIDGVVKNAEN